MKLTLEQKDARLKAATELLAAGLSHKEIGLRLGFTRKTIWNLFNPDRSTATLRAWKKKNKEHVAFKMREWRTNNPERHAQNVKRYQETNRDHYIDQRLRREYGVGTDFFERVFAEQNGLCAICKKPSSRRLHIDHCHSTNRVRGLLCGSCNRGLGLFKDDPSLLIASISYLRLHGVD